jgi:hypothetical protein
LHLDCITEALIAEKVAIRCYLAACYAVLFFTLIITNTATKQQIICLHAAIHLRETSV